MLWEVEIRPLGTPGQADGERDRVAAEFDLLTHASRGPDVVTAAARGYLLEGDFAEPDARRLCDELLVDPLVETFTLFTVNANQSPPVATDGIAWTVLLKPGVMDPAADSVTRAARDLGVPVAEARTFRRYFGPADVPAADRELLFRKVLANDAIEQVVAGPLRADHLAVGKPYTFKLVTVPVRDLDDAGLMTVSRDGTLALTLD
ncbi:MAG: phosphoribosylformylglycinamidine synthase subunit PurS, partial [Fimbriiglobus sp.]